MPLSPAISIGSVNTSATTDPTAIVVTDESTGSDGAIASRQILVYNNAGALVGSPPYIWAYPTPNPVTINPLTVDLAVNVVVNWLDGSGNVLYTTSLLAACTGFGEQFFYNLIQTESSSPSILQDVNYQQYKGTLRNYLDSAVQAISVGQSIGNAQQMILKEQYLVTNSNLYY